MTRPRTRAPLSLMALTLSVPEVYRDAGLPKAAAIYRLPPLRVSADEGGRASRK